MHQEGHLIYTYVNKTPNRNSQKDPEEPGLSDSLKREFFYPPPSCEHISLSSNPNLFFLASHLAFSPPLSFPYLRRELARRLIPAVALLRRFNCDGTPMRRRNPGLPLHLHTGSSRVIGRGFNPTPAKTPTHPRRVPAHMHARTHREALKRAPGECPSNAHSSHLINQLPTSNRNAAASQGPADPPASH